MNAHIIVGLRKTAAVLLISACTLIPVGCNQQDFDRTVALIASQIPTAIALTNTVLAAYSAFGVAQTGSDDHILASSIGPIVNADLTELKQLCDSYTAAPSTDSFNKIIAVVDRLVQEGDGALLNASGIKDAQSKAAATAVIGALDTVLHIIDGYVQASQTTAQVKRTAANRTVKLRQVSMYFDGRTLGDGVAVLHELESAPIQFVHRNDTPEENAHRFLEAEQDAGF